MGLLNGLLWIPAAHFPVRMRQMDSSMSGGLSAPCILNERTETEWLLDDPAVFTNRGGCVEPVTHEITAIWDITPDSRRHVNWTYNAHSALGQERVARAGHKEA